MPSVMKEAKIEPEGSEAGRRRRCSAGELWTLRLCSAAAAAGGLSARLLCALPLATTVRAEVAASTEFSMSSLPS